MPFSNTHKVCYYRFVVTVDDGSYQLSDKELVQFIIQGPSSSSH